MIYKTHKDLKSGDLIMFSEDKHFYHWLNGNCGIILLVDEKGAKWYNFKHKHCFYTFKIQFSALKKV